MRIRLCSVAYLKVITHGIFGIPPEALTRGRRICYSPQCDDTADDRTNGAAKPRGTCGASHRVDRGRPAVRGGEPATQDGGGKIPAAPTNVAHSLQAPSREVKRNLAAKHKRKKHGSPFGHARQTRPWVAEPDRISDPKGESCGHCQADLRGIEPRAVLRHQLTEVPPITPVVIETRQAEVVCPDCQRVTRGELPAGLDGGRSCGPRLAAMVVYRKHEQLLSYERVTQLCQDLFNVAMRSSPPVPVKWLGSRRGTSTGVGNRLRLFGTHCLFVQLEPPAQAANLVLFHLTETLLPPAVVDPDQHAIDEIHQTALRKERGNHLGPSRFLPTLGVGLPLPQGSQRLGFLFTRCSLLLPSGVLLRTFRPF